MGNNTQNIVSKDLSFVVKAIGSDLERTQVQLITLANANMLFHYWKVGHYILYLQNKEGWGSKVIDKLSQAIRSQYPEKKGYSRRNIFYMCQFAVAYPLAILEQLNKANEALVIPSLECILTQTKLLNQLVQQPVALIQGTEKQKDIFMQQPVVQEATIEKTLSAVYNMNISDIEEKFKKSIITRTNWASHIILLNSNLPLGERYWYITQAVANGWSRNILQMQIETKLFARQIIANVVIELKATPFKPEYMGQLNFYINVVDNTLRGKHDNKTIGLLLCNGGDKVVAQYALSGYDQPIGISDYQLSKAIPENLKSVLPTIEEVEEELSKISKQAN